jgi:hypothetical protein
LLITGVEAAWRKVPVNQVGLYGNPAWEVPESAVGESGILHY